MPLARRAREDGWYTPTVSPCTPHGPLLCCTPRIVEAVPGWAVTKGDFKCPQWLLPEIGKLLSRILDPNVSTRVSLAKVMENSWFKKGFKPVEDQQPQEEEEMKATNLGDIQAALSSTSENNLEEKGELEEIAETESFKVQKKDGKVKLQGSKEGRKGQLAIDAEIFEVTPSFHVVEVKKTAGDTLEYHNFCNQELKPSLKDIVWTWQGGEQPQK
ncbi:hypothetical protein GIB67_030596 [Kingdonia uniflora]|uniref:non-specific serine/threonine protein kinase n=1 Tax=Kingdonia uniflora TaxID=39325 RepID=A0A7J7PC41_9MAGN|nr:hypothetical protein GIB67_030596 [Kingdonia uniflora]